MTAEFVLRSFNVRHQVRNGEYRRAVLETLRPGDVVQAIMPETGEVIGTRVLDALDGREWPQRYLVQDWSADDEGHQLDEGQERVEMGWVLVRRPLTHQEAVKLLSAPTPPKPPFSWALYEKHMRRMYAAVLHGFAIPEEPWA